MLLKWCFHALSPTMERRRSCAGARVPNKRLHKVRDCRATALAPYGGWSACSDAHMCTCSSNNPLSSLCAGIPLKSLASEKERNISSLNQSRPLGQIEPIDSASTSFPFLSPAFFSETELTGIVG